MKASKWLSLFLAVCLFVGSSVLCLAEASDEKPFMVGVLTAANMDEQTYGENMNRCYEKYRQISEKKGGANMPKRLEFKFFDTLNTLLLALYSGKINAISINRFTGQYIIGQDETIKESETVNFTMPRCAYSMMFMKKDEELCKKFSGVIEYLKNSGQMDTLVQQHIIPYLNGGNPEPAELPHFDDAETITVAVTGDLPPLDFATADGKPAGFNVALLSEISNQLHINIKLLQVETGARAMMLSTGKCDAVFWTSTPTTDTAAEAENVDPDEKELGDMMVKLFYDYDRPEGTVFTTPYLIDSEVMLVKG